MQPSIVAVANQYKINTDFLYKFLDGLSEEQEFMRPDDKANSANWLVGHLLNSRFEINKFMGEDSDCQWCDFYCNGSKIQDKSVYPSIAEMKPIWESISAKMLDSISKLNEDALNAPVSLGVPNPDKNLQGLLGFFAFHEGMHLGQILYLKRILR